jgi:hypothetical protein
MSREPTVPRDEETPRASSATLDSVAAARVTAYAFDPQGVRWELIVEELDA